MCSEFLLEALELPPRKRKKTRKKKRGEEKEYVLSSPTVAF